MKSDMDKCQTETQSAGERAPRNLGLLFRSIVELTRVSRGDLRAYRGAWRLRVKNSDLVRETSAKITSATKLFWNAK